MTAQQALDALAAGTLTDVDGAVPPSSHPMPKSTAHDCARKIRLEREGRRGGLERHEPATAQTELLRRLTIAADRLTKRVERKSRTGTNDSQLAETLTKAARATGAVIAAQRAAGSSAPPVPPDNGNGKPSTEPASPLAAIAADIERADRSARASASAPRALGADPVP
jgi:hypothetical protein